ncbi:allantoicase isoform X2 [Pseudoliparis swirei]|uniref:allantoicase isoform X2 n=1 Tax=Pseudoliparis swirei TaxID=2059687 RepID=UPI0024BED3B4|nr:allantoicase isoform X2 [Pseudoliparis swirei]
MADGWETARRLDRPKHLEGVLQVPGSEWAVFRLGCPGLISRVEVHTDHFKGNFPDSCRLEACFLSPKAESSWRSGSWGVLLPPQKLRPHHRCVFGEDELALRSPVTHVRLVISPDGGVSRLRLWGRPTVPPAAAPTNQERPASKL